MRKIICNNNKGQALTIGYKAPYWLDSIEGISMPDYTIYTTKGSTQDGENYVSSNANMRNIELTILITENVIDNVNALYNIFVPKQTGTLFYYRDDIECKIDYEVESMKIDSNGYLKRASVSLSCPYPFFQDLKETKLNMAYWQGSIVFPFTLPPTSFTMTTKIKNLIANATNNSNIDLGMTIKFIANGTVTNPSLLNVNTREYFKVNTIMLTGDEIVVSTHYKQKKILLYRNGLETDITHLIDYESAWLKVYDGDNLFRYNADADINNLDVAIYYRLLRLGVV